MRTLIATIRPILLVAACLCAATQMRAQPILAGPAVGMEVGIIDAAVPVFAGAPGCGVFTDGRLRRERAGARLMLPELLGEDIGATFGLGWSRWNGSFTALPVDPFWGLDRETNTAVPGERRYLLETRIDRIEIEALGTIRVGPFGFGLGPTIAYTLGSSIMQTDTILGPATIAFADGASGRRMNEGTALTARPLGFGGVAAAWYTTEFSRHLDLQLELAGTVDLISPVSGADFRGYGIRGTIAFLFNPTRSREATPAVVTAQDTRHDNNAPVPIAELLPPRRKTLSASIAMYGLNEHGEPSDAATVRMREILLRRHVTLLPTVWFPAEASALPERYARYSRDDVRLYSIDSLHHLDDRSLQNELLNVVGARLREHPSARITLISSQSPLAQQRIAALRSYLNGIWGIDTSRILQDVRPSERRGDNDPRDEAFVRFLSPDTALFAPVVLLQTERSFGVPIVKLDPTFQSATGIKGWVINLSHQGSVIARYASHGEGEREDSLYQWQPMYDRLVKDTSRLEATFTIEDSAGTLETAHAEIPLRVELERRTIARVSDLRAGRTQSLYHIPMGNAEGPETYDTALVKRIAEDLRDRDEITVITPATLESGNASSPSQSRDNAAAVMSALRAAVRDRGLRGVKFQQRNDGAEPLLSLLPAVSTGDVIVMLQRRSSDGDR